MSDDVITLDSSDDETQTTNIKKPASEKNVSQDDLRSIVGPFPLSTPRPHQNIVLKNLLSNVNFIPKRIRPRTFPTGISSAQNISGLYLPAGIQVKKKPNLQNQKYSLNTVPLHQRILNNSLPHLQVKSLRKNVQYSKSPIQNISVRQNGMSASQKVINALPPGLTITRTTGNNKVSLKRGFSPANAATKKKRRVTNLCQIDSVRSIPIYDLEDYEEQQYEILPIEFELNPDSAKTDLMIGDNLMTDIANGRDPVAEPTINSVIEGVLENDSSAVAIIDTIENNQNTATKETKYTFDEIENRIKENKLETDTDCLKVHLDLEKDLNADAVTINMIADALELVPNPKPVMVKVMLGHKEDFEIADILKKQNTIPVNPVIKLCDEPLNESCQKFVDLCLKLDTSADMKEIIDKKVIAYYRSVHPNFTSSKSFCALVEEKIKEMTTNPSGVYLYIKAVVDELRVRRVKVKKRSPRESEEKDNVASTSTAVDHENKDEANDEDSKITRHIEKLERALAKLNKAIQKLEEKEVDYDDENCSSYILADRYKARLVRVYDKLCSLTGERNAARRRTAIRDVKRLPLTCSRLPKLAEAVKAMAAKKPHWFPDYREVLACVENCAKDQKLDMRPHEMQNEARLLFVEIGTMLQQRRQQQEYEDMSWRLGASIDPADSDPALALALQKNREKSSHMEMEVINKFAEKQVRLKLMPENVGDLDSSSSESSNNEDNNTDNEDDNEQDNEDDADLPDTIDGVLKASQEISAVNSNTCTNNVADDLLLDKNNDTSNVTKIDSPPDKKSKVVLTTTILSPYKSHENIHTDEVSSNVSDSDGSVDSFDSNPSLIEVSSSSDDEKPKEENFPHLNTKRPESAMSGVDVIEDSNSMSKVLEVGDSD